MIRDGYIVSLHSCYFKQENILIGASEGGNWKTKSPYLQMCKWRAKQKNIKHILVTKILTGK